ncbi:MAG: Deoxyadenosine/deoxycytidine kinase [Bacteroidetes bacterium ADurb.Bin035]|jgi:deoxyadenosine/deoxycytidine kinase|nr:deoxynucleoside kinase [Bacteroidales bacterium]OQC48597.1 MAG: Deoxyadenosine/deoxycytidine kinase [Bacteroidetes bacterium ADurb.Bin035]MBP8946180.1 deoxynucleoside kinase [Bacteroidales bacterium]HNT70951.1 deoxynucleoside kinase [Bacteroidales bacterium]HNW21041.1 deoxynucleoside kinase [Bacteroidales bacterium]
MLHIAIAGNIGSGKTTLTELLSKHFKLDALYEDVDTNPYLENFYNDMKRWSFNLQIYFLNSRFSQVVNIQKQQLNVIQDRTIYEDAHIFALNLYEMGLMDEIDFKTYRDLFDLMTSFLRPPDLLIYLQADVSTLVKQIQIRGREYETSIRIDYLQSLNEKYEKWINNYNHGKKLIINVDNKDFLHNPEDLGVVINLINAELFGLF